MHPEAPLTVCVMVLRWTTGPSARATRPVVVARAPEPTLLDSVKVTQDPVNIDEDALLEKTVELVMVVLVLVSSVDSADDVGVAVGQSV